jgi:hypothetical protein
MFKLKPKKFSDKIVLQGKYKKEKIKRRKISNSRSA